MKSNLRQSFVVLSFFAAAVGGVIFDAHRSQALGLIVIGLAGSVYLFFSAEMSQRRTDNFSNTTAKLLSVSGVGNPYVAIMDEELNKTGKYDHALEVLDEAISINPNDMDSLARYVVISALHISLDSHVSPASISPVSRAYAKTSERIERGLSTDQHKYDFMVAKGILLDEIGQHVQARNWFTQAARFQKCSFPFWRFLTATSFGKQKLYLEALTELEHARNEGATGPTFDFQYARSLVSVGDYDRALVLLKKVRARRGNYYHLVDILSSTHHFAWNPTQSAYFAILSAVHIFRKSKAQSLRHLRNALRSLIVPILMVLSTATESLARRLPLLSKSKLTNLSDPGNPYVSLGTSLISSENYLAAQKQFIKAAKRSNRLNTWMNLCSASIIVRDWKEARIAHDHLSRHWPEKIPEGYDELICAGLADGTVSFDFRIH
jgi:tetratricopeptide (TPR) repeat protein